MSDLQKTVDALLTAAVAAADEPTTTGSTRALQLTQAAHTKHALLNHQVPPMLPAAQAFTAPGGPAAQ